VFQQQPQLTCQSLELAVRATCLTVNNVASVAFAGNVINGVLGLYGDDVDAATAVAAKQHAQQLFALAVSCLKLAAVQPQSTACTVPPVAECIAYQTIAAAAARNMGLQLSGLAAQARVTGSTPAQQLAASSDSTIAASSSSSNSGSSSSGAGSSASVDLGRLGMVLTARGMLLEAVACCTAASATGMAAASSLDRRSTSDNLAFTKDMERSLDSWGLWCEKVHQFLQQQGFDSGGAASGQASSAARQQLLQLQDCLQQELVAAWELLSGITGSSSGSGSGRKGTDSMDAASSGCCKPLLAADVQRFVTETLPGITQHSKALAEAVCAQFPLPYCCNNPGCVELRGASELQLVGGKGCVCARCRWVMDDVSMAELAMQLPAVPGD
jgi:hypothetical protein